MVEALTNKRCYIYFLCYIFNKKPIENPGSNTFKIEDFRNRKNVNNKKDYTCLSHVGKDFISPHNIAIETCEDLIYQLQHIDKRCEESTLT